MSTYIINKNNVITINRGDYAEFKFKFKVGKFPYDHDLIVNDGDILFFGLMDPGVHFEHALLKKEYTSNFINDEGYFILTLESDDTLELVPGVYYYEIKLLDINAHITTLIQKTKFIIVD